MAGEIIFEFQTFANTVKVSAIDADSGLEVSIVGPRNASQLDLQNTAKAKLAYMMAKSRGGGGSGGPGRSV